MSKHHNQRGVGVNRRGIGVNRRDINDIIDDKDLNKQTVRARNLETQRIDRLIKRLRNASINVNRHIVVDSDDQTNWIQHKNDNFNVPDKNGRVLVNIGHEKEEPDIYLSDQFKDRVKPHQIGGIRFLYDNVIESVKMSKTTEGFGCILSHSMGLGKTMQIIALVDIFINNSIGKTVMIVMPVNVLNNWITEFDKWLPQKERGFDVISIDKLNAKSRDKHISIWHNSGGVLLIGYEKFLRITANCSKKLENPNDCHREEIRSATNLLTALIDPGPQLIICDEGHRIKNDLAGISRALKQIKTKRRVILTGYPLQNRLQEYYCMVDFVRPNYLGLKWEFSNTFDAPITNGQCKDATDTDKELMRGRSHVLNQLLKGFIQRRNEDVLKLELKEKQEFVIYCKLSEIQRQLMSTFLNTTLKSDTLGHNAGKISLFKTFVICAKISNHPDIINNVLKRGLESEELDPEEHPDLFSYAWAKPFFKNYGTDLLENSNKMVVLFNIIEESVAKENKILVFSQWLFTLDLIGRLLQSRDVFKGKSSKFKKYYRIDGQTSSGERNELINKFNSEDNKEIYIFLISTKAGGIGINLTGANRIVLFDACWNPCHDAQAACRIFRFGQEKECFIYRLISDNSMEKRVFNKQIFKQGMSRGVVDMQNIEQKLKHHEIRALIIELVKELDQIEDNFDRQKLIDLKDPLLLSVSKKCESSLTSTPFLMEEMLKDNKNLALNSKQKIKAFEDFEAAEHSNNAIKPGSGQSIDLLANKLMASKI